MIKSTISTIKDNWWVIEIHCMTFFREQLWWDGIHLMNLVYLETKLNVRPVYVNTRVDPLTTSWLWKSAAKSDFTRSTKWIIFCQITFVYIYQLFVYICQLFVYVLNFHAKIPIRSSESDLAETANFKTKMALLASIYYL